MCKVFSGERDSIGIIGSGTLASSLVPYLAERNISISGILGRNAAAVGGLARRTGLRIFGTYRELVRESRVVVLAVADDAIAETVGQVSRDSLKGRLVLHSSGCLSLDVLVSAAKAGAVTAVVHPLMTLAGNRKGKNHLNNAPIGIACGHPAWKKALNQWFTDAGHTVFSLAPGNRPLYHAGAVLACAGLRRLILAAAHLLEAGGVGSPKTARDILRPLAGKTLNLCLSAGNSLETGPWAREDTKTIDSHLKALKHEFPEFYSLYKSLLLCNPEGLEKPGIARPNRRKRGA